MSSWVMVSGGLPSNSWHSQYGSLKCAAICIRVTQAATGRGESVMAFNSAAASVSQARAAPIQRSRPGGSRRLAGRGRCCSRRGCRRGRRWDRGNWCQRWTSLAVLVLCSKHRVDRMSPSGGGIWSVMMCMCAEIFGGHSDGRLAFIRHRPCYVIFYFKYNQIVMQI